jgi:formiminoglutamase
MSSIQILTKGPGQGSFAETNVKDRYPFLISVPHGGTGVPEVARPRLLLSDEDLRYYCDPATQQIFGYRDRVAAYIDTPVSRMVVDLNRPPLPLPLHDPDGIIKTRTIDGREVWQPGKVLDLPLIHFLLMAHYFPYHQQIDELIDHNPIGIAFDCHSMLPQGSGRQPDASKARPVICLGNNGDSHGRARNGSLATCSEDWITSLADVFREVLPPGASVAINDPFPGGFIANAHYWRKGIPWIQIEINRSLYEPAPGSRGAPPEADPVNNLRERIWKVLTVFWERVGK